MLVVTMENSVAHSRTMVLTSPSPTRAAWSTGFIPPEVGNLSLLIRLDLGHNKLFGEYEKTRCSLIFRPRFGSGRALVSSPSVPMSAFATTLEIRFELSERVKLGSRHLQLIQVGAALHAVYSRHRIELFGL